MSSRGKGCALGCGAILLVIVAVVGVTAFGLKLTHAVFPGSVGMVRSTSLEGYDAYFRTDLGMVGDVMAHPAVWHLRVPRAFIWNELGENGVLNSAHDNPRKTYILGIDAILDQENGHFNRLPIFDQPDRDKEFLADLENSSATRINEVRVGKDLCMTYNEFFHDEYCRTPNVFCMVKSSFRGWHVTLHVRPAVYHGSKAVLEDVCTRMRKTLAEYTISVDDISKDSDLRKENLK